MTISTIPKSIYENFRNSFLKKHMWTHYLFHCSLCLFKDNLVGNYKPYTPKNWVDCYDFI